MSRENICCTILGSFKFKSNIDRIIEEFEDFGVHVLAPEKGQVFSPPTHRHLQIATSFRPLPSERSFPVKVVEDDFLRSIARSDLAYLVCIDGYVGNVVSLEVGFAIAKRIPLYASEKINLKLDPDINWQKQVAQIPVMTVQNAIEDLRSRS
jgi:nucleoside 2-deoxyribosyltransferase